jgi:hypothetical protein
MSSTISHPPREQLYIRFCSNKHTQGLVEDMFGNDRLAEARQTDEVARLFQLIASADVDAGFASSIELP